MIPQNVIQLPFVTPTQFTPPTMEETSLHAAKIGLPDTEAQRFYLFYDSKDWFVGRNKMKQWRSSMALWKLNWMERTGTSQNHVNTVTLSKEYDRIIERMDLIKRNYSGFQSWTVEDVREFKVLKVRRDELKTLLGITI